MPNLSHLPTRVTDPVSTHDIPVVVAPDAGPTGTGLLSLNDLAFSTLMQQAFDLFLRSGELKAGSNMSIDFADPTGITFSNVAGSSYTAENARDDVGAAMRGEQDYLDVIVSDVGDTITYSLSNVLKGRILNLESARALLQSKDALAAAGSNTLNYMSFPGTTGNYIDTPSNAAFNVAGNVGWACRVKMPSVAPSVDQVIFARRGSATGASQFSFFIESNGQMHTTMYFDNAGVVSAGSVAQTTATTPLAFDGNWIWIKIYRTQSDGQVSFFTAPDTGSNYVLPSTWTTFQLNRGSQQPGNDLWPNSGAPFEISGYNAGTTSMSSIPVGRVLMFGNTTLLGTPVADANASDYTSGTSWTDPQGRVWTLRGTASIVSGGGSSTAISNTAAEFTLGETDALNAVAFNNHDTIMWNTEATLVNTSGANANFTPKLRVAGVDLFTWPAAIVVPSAAGSVYNLGCAVRLSRNSVDGTTQIARAQLIINNAAGGTDLGSISMVSNLANMSANRTGAIATITTVPQLQLRMTMTQSPSVSARPLRTQVFLARA